MTKKTEKISFEDAIKELEDITEKLERGQLSLEDSIKAYERGMELKHTCTELLKEAEGKIEMLSKSPEGKLKKEPARKEKPKKGLADDEDILF
ncbi:MAG: exodeoxyribonuclease VII small subunit [Leptospiraceae bacterium]|nr:exodeoxyribonuclease VII small subunit [Leptospiraceae bacterium]MCP5499638.1 exodeoxyribonuclease VII small subunit [Leptospiraceae bacterium]